MQRAVNRQCEAMDRYRLWLWHLNADNLHIDVKSHLFGNAQSDSVSSIMPIAIRDSISAFSLSFVATESLYGDVAIGLCEQVFIKCSIFFTGTVISPNIAYSPSKNFVNKSLSVKCEASLSLKFMSSAFHLF